MAKVQRLGRNSTLTLVQSAAEAQTSEDVPIPAGVVLRGEEEALIWGQFTRARARNDWRDFDLLLIAKAVRIEADIRKHQRVLDQTGPLLKNPKGTPIANPMFSIVDTLQRQQLAIIRSLSLSQTETDARTKNASGLLQHRLRNIFGDTDDLIAKPD